MSAAFVPQLRAETTATRERMSEVIRDVQLLPPGERPAAMRAACTELATLRAALADALESATALQEILESYAPEVEPLCPSES